MALTIKNSLGNVRAHVRPVATEIDEKYGLYWIWGFGSSQDHAKGLALDFMVYNSNQTEVRTSVGDAIAKYLVDNHKRLNLSYVIWRQRIWNAVTESPRPWSAWRKMADRGNPTENHMDHVHVSFKPSGTYKPPGGSPKPTPAPKPVPKPKPPATTKIKFKNVAFGKRNGDVQQFQKRLISKGYKIPAGATGYYGDQTRRAVMSFQRNQGWTGKGADGLPGPSTFARLGFTNA